MYLPLKDILISSPVKLWLKTFSETFPTSGELEDTSTWPFSSVINLITLLRFSRASSDARSIACKNALELMTNSDLVSVGINRDVSGNYLQVNESKIINLLI